VESEQSSNTTPRTPAVADEQPAHEESQADFVDIADN
jgi:hypothetical protein